MAKKCVKCGAELQDGDVFCASCGEKTSDNASSDVQTGDAPNSDSNGGKGCGCVTLLAIVVALFIFVSELMTPKESVENVFEPMTLKEAVEKTLADGSIAPIIEVYEKAAEQDKAKVAYEMTEYYFDAVEKIVQSDDNDKISKLSRSLSELNVDNGKNEYLGMLNKLKGLFYEYHSKGEKYKSIDKICKKLFGTNTGSYRKEIGDIMRERVYITQRMDDGSYVAYDYNRIPNYEYDGFWGLRQNGGTDIVGDNCIGVLEPVGNISFERAGAYWVNLIPTNRTQKYEKKLGGFVQTLPVYKIIGDDLKNQLLDYAKNGASLKELPVEVLKQPLKRLKAKYAGKNIHSLKLGPDGYDATTTVDTVAKVSGIKRREKTRYGASTIVYNTGISIYAGASGNNWKLSYRPEGADKPFALSNGITMGMTKEEVLNKMGNDFINCTEGGTNSYISYLLPNDQRLDLEFSGSGETLSCITFTIP